MTMPWPEKVLLVGCGNMGGAMLAGWLAGGLDASRFVVFDPKLEAAPDGVGLLRALPEDDYDAILLGVKPQMLDDLAPQIEPLARAGTTVFSILAGVELATLAARFPQARAYVRVMPNLAARIGKSPIALAESGLDETARDAAIAFMRPLGTPEWVPEDTFDLVTALAGSGPAFVYRFIDALSGAAAYLGLEEAQAERLAQAMVEGAAALAMASEHAPGELANRVASPGGVTREGLDVLDANGALATLVRQTLRAARDRSAEMAREARG